MASERKQKDGVINNLRDLFGNVLHIDIIKSVASECNFDVQRSSNILLEMTNNMEEPKRKPKKVPQRTPPVSPPKVVKSKKTLDLERVVNNIRQGYKVLVILRGLPGSGKSHLSKAITEVTLGPGTNAHHILSTDDFFMQQWGYTFDPSRLQEAHEWNHRRAFRAMSRGLSPVIIDNTNTQMWEIKPYAMMATDYGYIIEILEPDTWWAFNDKELSRRNSHNVPRSKIKDMLDRYDKNVTPQKLLSAYNLQYKFQKPPQFRLMPPLMHNTINRYRNTVDGAVVKSQSTSALEQKSNGVDINLMDFSEVSNSTKSESQNLVSNPVDDILMCRQDNPGNVLQPTPKPFDIENAWGIDEKALQSWDIVTPIKSELRVSSIVSSGQEEAKPETKENSTSFEPNDYLRENLKVLMAQSRDINDGTPFKLFKPSRKIMVDQSCLTEDVDHDGDEESRIKDLMDLFPKVSRGAILELYNKCQKDFHWTVDLLLEDNNLENTKIEEAEDTKVESIETIVNQEVKEQEPPRESKSFKRKTLSEDCIELKKCIESKFDLSKDHYSEHVYKVKQTKFPVDPQPSTSATIESESDLESDEELTHDPKNFIELNLGDTLVEQLETLFGGQDVFPKGYQPVVQMPLALVRQIYSFYIESICQQMEAQSHILERLVKEDEDFARRLQLEETKEDAPATLKEIMDEQAAISLQRREENEWKNLTADNLAKKLTQQKLFSAFPTLDRDALLEIWHAYDFDYNKTVEDLMASVGNDYVNGSGEMIKEPPINAKVLQELKAAEENCEEFEASGEEKPATFYRDEANKHLRKRTELYEMAKSYQQRGMTEVAWFYSELAQKETKLFDKANHFAAAAFIEEHAKRLQKFDTLDLHYFYVKEAIPNLDMFIDRNINLLKGGNRNGQDLFIITGRGKNSAGGFSKIKPAVIARLKKRKIGFVQLNPGLLKIRVLKNSLVTSDIP